MNYPGGKGAEGVYQAIINQLPPHYSYIEPFLGGGAILRYKKPAVQSWACEFDPKVFGEFVAGFKHPDFHEPRRLVDLMDIYDAGEDQHTWYDAEGVPNLYVMRKDAIAFLKGFLFQGRDPAHNLVYCDPPYLLEARSTKKQVYTHDFSTWFDHEELLNLLLRLKCNVMISGYDHPLYNGKLADWRKITFTGVTRGGPRTECLWMNYPEPVELHDYRYLGSNFREREKLKRKKDRMIGKLQKMPAQERYALMAAIQEYSGSIAKNGDVAGGTNIGASAPANFVPGENSDDVVDRYGYKGRDPVQHPTRPHVPAAPADIAENGEARGLVPIGTLKKGAYIEYDGGIFMIRSVPTKANSSYHAAWPGSDSGPLLTRPTLVRPLPKDVALEKYAQLRSNAAGEAQ